MTKACKSACDKAYRESDAARAVRAAYRLTDARRAQQAVRNRARLQTPEYRAYMKAYLKAYQLSAVGRARHAAAVAKYTATDAARAKKAAAQKALRKSDAGRIWLAKYLAANPGRQEASTRRYLAAHPGKRASWRAKRRAAELRATPTWANKTAMEAIYVAAAQRTRETGIVHHVDHIYPLRGNTVSGLHVEANLQILKATENLRKSYKHPDHLAA